MNKASLTKATKEIVAKNLEGATLKVAEVYVDAVIEAIQNALVEGEKVAIVGFGNFEVVERAARTARNPRTGEEIEVGASKAVKFKPLKALKEAVNV